MGPKQGDGLIRERAEVPNEKWGRGLVKEVDGGLAGEAGTDTLTDHTLQQARADLQVAEQVDVGAHLTQGVQEPDYGQHLLQGEGNEAEAALLKGRDPTYNPPAFWRLMQLWQSTCSACLRPRASIPALLRKRKHT